MSRIARSYYERPDIPDAKLHCDICGKPGRFVPVYYGRKVIGKVLCPDCDFINGTAKTTLNKQQETKNTQAIGSANDD